MDHTDLPRWRGFNIQNKFVAGQREEPFREEDRLGALDDAVTYAGRHDVHLNLNLHRAPGFTARLRTDVRQPPKGRLGRQRAVPAGRGPWRSRPVKCRAPTTADFG